MTATFINASGAPGDPDVGAEATSVFTAIDAGAEGLARVVRLRLFYTDRAHFAPLHAVRLPFFTERLAVDDYPATTGIITGGRGGLPPLLDAEAIAGNGKQAFYAPEVWRSVAGHTAPLPVSHGTACDGVVFVSGQVAYDAQAQVSGTTAVDQLDTALANLDAILRAAGADGSAIAALTVYVVEAAFPDHDAAAAHFARAVADRCGAAPPVVTWVGVRELFQPGLLVEVEAAVALGDGVRRGGAARVPRGTPPSATATAAGAWCFATATAELAEPADEAAAAAATREALAALSAGLAGLGLDETALRRITAWCAPADRCAVVEALVQEALPEVAALAVPLAVAGADGGRIVLEAIGRTGD